MKFPKEDLQELAWCGASERIDGYQVIENKIIDIGRWSTHHRLLFTKDGKVYGVTYSQGSTEMQDERPFEYEPDEIEAKEYIAVQETVTIYKEVS